MDVLLQIVKVHADAFLKGIGVSIKLAIIVWFAGLSIGTILGAFAAKFKKTVGLPTRVCSFILSGIPVLVFLFWAHYPLQAQLGVVIDPFLTAAAVLSIINIFSVSDIISGSLNDFPSQYVVAAKVCGLSEYTTVVSIQLPIILRQVIPQLLILQVIMLHTTLFASLISVEEIFRVSQRVNAIEYKPIQIYTALAILFLAICLPINGFAIWLRKRFTRNISEQ